MKYVEASEEIIKKEKKRGQEGKSIEKKWEEIERIVQGAMVKRIKRRRKELGFKDWWDKSCTRKEREVKRSYKKWKRGKIGKERYLEGRREFRATGEETERKKTRGGRGIKESEEGSGGVQIYKQEKRNGRKTI